MSKLPGQRTIWLRRVPGEKDQNARGQDAQDHIAQRKPAKSDAGERPTRDAESAKRRRTQPPANENDAAAPKRAGAWLPNGAANPAAARLVGEIARELLDIGRPLCLLAPNGAVLYANPAFHKLTAGMADADLGETFQQISAEIALASKPVPREDTLTSGRAQRHLRSQHHPVNGADGSLRAIVGFYEDVSAEVRASRAVGEAQTRLFDLTRLVSDWLWETDRDLNIVSASRRVVDVLGVLPHELRGRNLLDIGEFTDADGLSVGEPETVARRNPFRDLPFTVPVEGDGNRLFLLSGLPVFNEATEEFIGYRGTARDITAQTEAQRNAIAHQDNLSDAIANIGEGFALFDAEDRLILCNDRFRDFFPHAARAIRPGVGFESLARLVAEGGDVRLPGGDVERWLRRRTTAWEHPESAFELQLADGRWIKISDHRMADGRTVSVRTDITEQKEREKALIDAKLAAEIGDRAKSEFLANMSHELRTPLNHVIGFSEVLVREYFGPLGNQRYVDYAHQILASGQNLLVMINEMLEMAQAQTGTLELRHDLIDPAPIIESAVAQISDHAAAAELELEVDCAALPAIFADPRRLKQVLLNLLNNAVKFSRPGGRVRLNAGVHGEDELVITIADTGIGIAKRDIDKVLTPFGQANGGFDRAYAGTGLGLPLSKMLVELHGGTLAIDSEVGVGTTVTVRLPIERAASAATRKTEASEA